MNKDKILSFWFLKIGLILIGTWYLLLLYLFPFYPTCLTKSDNEISFIFYMAILSSIFLVFITSFALFIVRTMRSISYGHEDNEQKDLVLDFFSAAESHLLYQIRILAIFSFLILSLSIISIIMGVKDEETIFSLAFFTLFIVFAMNAMLKWLLNKPGDLTAPRWSPTPWIALATFLITLVNIFANAKEAIEYLKQSFIMLWILFEDTEREISEEIILTVIFYLVVLIVSGVTVYKRFRDVINDVKKLLSLITEKLSKHSSKKAR